MILFLSDDWGGVRIHSKESREKLIEAGIDMDSNRFDKFDMLESNDDLESLFEIILKHKDHYGNHPVITAVTNVANPDFKKMRENNFAEYFYESFTDTLKRYPNHTRVYDLYKKGIELNIFRPELHGREHLQVKWWMNYLHKNNKLVRAAFENEYFHLSGKYLGNPWHRGLDAAFDIADITEVKDQKKIVTDGVRLFEELFNYKPVLLVPPSMHYNDKLVEDKGSSEIKMINVSRFRKMPLGRGKYRIKLHYNGQKNKFGQRYLVRNTIFEPNNNPYGDGVDTCMKEIDTAFNHKLPAVISNHRAAFVSGIDLKNGNRGLKALDNLLKSIFLKWPEAEFLTAGKFYEVMCNNEQH